MKISKDRPIDTLLDVFDAWASTTSTFEEDVQSELRSCAKSYIEHFVGYVKSIANGDPDAFFTANENSRMIESLLRYHDKLPAPLRMQRILAFFQSDYVANVPEIRIGSEFFALLRQRLRQGEYMNKEKNRIRFGGLFYDVRFISTYAPYCDAMVVDNLMFQWATDPLIDLPKRLCVRLISRRNWNEFLTYLDELEADRRPEVDVALKLIRPRQRQDSGVDTSGFSYTQGPVVAACWAKLRVGTYSSSSSSTVRRASYSQPGKAAKI